MVQKKIIFFYYYFVNKILQFFDVYDVYELKLIYFFFINLIGNIDMVFVLDSILGIILVVKNLNKRERSDYSIVVKVVDKGILVFSSIVIINIYIIMFNDVLFKFSQQKYVIDVMESFFLGSLVVTVKVDSQFFVNYEIIKGNDNVIFFVNFNFGVVYFKGRMDYEILDLYKLIVLVINNVGKFDMIFVWIYVLDVNDNEFYFIKIFYIGSLSENFFLESFVLGIDGKFLVIIVRDDDINENV